MPNAPTLILLAASLSAVLNFLLVQCGARLPFSKQPSVDRWHSRATPDSGGLAIFAALAVVYLTAFRGQHTVAALAAAALWLLGTFDDRAQFRARTKFAGQALVVALAVAGGVVMHVSSWPLLNWALSWFWLIGITNAFNLIDNMDGLAAGVTVVIASFQGLALYSRGQHQDALLAGVIAATFAGFLLFNGKPALIFMGDGGSMLAGFTLAALTVAAPREASGSGVAGLVGAALLFAYPIFDTTLVSILRRAAGRPISRGGRDHSSHRLASSGLREGAVVVMLWAFSVLGCATGLLLTRIPVATPAAVSLWAVFGALFGILVSRLPAAAAPPRRRWRPALGAALAGVLEALLTAVVALVSCLVWFQAHAAEPPWGTLLTAAPLLMLVHAAAAALARSCGASRLAFSRSVRLSRIALLAIGLAAFMLSTGSYPRGAALAYPLFAFLLGLGLRRWTPRGRFAAVRAGLCFSAEERSAAIPVAIYGTDTEARALARFLYEAPSLGLRPAAFLEAGAPHCGSLDGLPVSSLDPGLARWREAGAVATIVTTAQRDSGSWAMARELLQQAGWRVCTLELQATPRPVSAPTSRDTVEVMV